MEKIITCGYFEISNQDDIAIVRIKKMYLSSLVI